MIKSADPAAEVSELLREAARWHLAGLLMRRPRPERSERVAALAGESGDPTLADAASRYAEGSEGAYLAVLGPGGPVSPRLVGYRPLEDPGRLLAEIASFHGAFAYRVDAEDPPDHVAVAADFAGYLALKEAWAVNEGRHDDASTTADARARHVDRHVRPVARGMLARLAHIDWPEDHLTATLRAIASMAGAGQPGPDASAELAEDAPFLRPGLDDAVFDCGDVARGGTAPCAGGCPWAAADEGDPGPAR